jgi:hypothetical protein
MNQKSRKYATLFGAVCGSLLMSAAAIPQVVLAQQLNSQVNGCPRIFYEEPHNNRVFVPQGCPPNTITQRFLEQGLIPVSPVGANPSPDQTRLGVGGETLPVRPVAPNSGVQTLPPAQQQAPIATVLPTNGRVDVRLVNGTGANVTYQVVGDTAPRSLQGKSNALLQGLRLPTTLTFYREDGGLLEVTPQRTSQRGILAVTLRETTEVGTDRGALRIAENGAVFLN